MVPRSRCRPCPSNQSSFHCPDLPGAQVAAALLDHQAAEPPHHVVVDLAELAWRRSRCGSSCPSRAGRDSGPRSPRGRPDPTRLRPVRSSDLLPEPLHRPLRRPAVQVIAADPALLPQPTRHPSAEVAAEEVEALPALTEVDHPRLVRVQLEAPARSSISPDRVAGPASPAPRGGTSPRQSSA